MIGEKVVGVEDVDPVWRDRVLREVSQVAGNDHVTTSDYRCGENMAVVGIGKVEGGDQRLVSSYQAIPCRLIHPIAGALEGCSITARLVAEQGIDPFPMDVSGPLCVEKIVNRQLKKNIPHRCRIENVGVKKGGEARHRAPYPMS